MGMLNITGNHINQLVLFTLQECPLFLVIPVKHTPVSLCSLPTCSTVGESPICRISFIRVFTLFVANCMARYNIGMI